jgi:hypothetical protein
MFNFLERHRWLRVIITVIVTPLLVNAIPVSKFSNQSTDERIIAIAQWTVIAAVVAFQRKRSRDMIIGWMFKILGITALIALSSVFVAGTHERDRRRREDDDY